MPPAIHRWHARGWHQCAWPWHYRARSHAPGGRTRRSAPTLGLRSVLL